MKVPEKPEEDDLFGQPSPEEDGLFSPGGGLFSTGGKLFDDDDAEDVSSNFKFKCKFSKIMLTSHKICTQFGFVLLCCDCHYIWWAP